MLYLNLNKIEKVPPNNLKIGNGLVQFIRMGKCIGHRWLSPVKTPNKHQLFRSHKMPHQEKNTSENDQEMSQSQTNSWHLEEETNNTGSLPTARTQSKVSSCLPRQYDFEKLVSMNCKCHNHRPQNNSRHLEVETQNTDSHITARTQLK